MNPENPQIAFRFNNHPSDYGTKMEAESGSPPASAATLQLVREFDELETPLADDAERLANHLIEDETAREIWPGNLLFCFFGNSYEQNSLRPSELKALTCIIKGILTQIDESEPTPSDSDPEPANQSPEEALLLPDLAHFDQLGLNQAVGFPEIFFEQMQCDCLDWQTVRRKLPSSCPGRLCKHLSRLIHVNIGQAQAISEPLKRLIAWAGANKGTLPPQPQWELLADEPESIIGASGGGKTIAIFAPVEEGKYNLFTYVIADRHWADNQRPTQIDQPALRDFLSRFIASESADGDSAT